MRGREGVATLQPEQDPKPNGTSGWIQWMSHASNRCLKPGVRMLASYLQMLRIPSIYQAAKSEGLDAAF